MGPFQHPGGGVFGAGRAAAMRMADDLKLDLDKALRESWTMKLYSADNSELMEVSALERNGDELVIKGKVFGTMPMTAKLTPQEARAALRLLNLRLVLFLLTLPFRKSA